MSDTVKKALADIDNIEIRSEAVSVADLNGAAVKMAADNDIVIFATDPSNTADLGAIERIAKQRRDNSVFLALTDKDMPLSRARALSNAGVDDVLPFPMPDAELAEQIVKWSRKISASQAGGGERSGAVIAVAQARGGIGSTTVAVNLADQLQGRKSRFRKDPLRNVAVLDLDLQFGTVGDFLDIEPQEALMQMAIDAIMPDAMWVEQSMVKGSTGLNVISAPVRFAPLDSIRPAQIEGLIEALRQANDYVVVDLPRAMVNWIEPVIAAADQMIVVTDTTVPSIRAAARLIEFYTAEHPSLKIEIVINHEKKPFVMAQHQKEAARVLDRKFNHWLPHDPKAAREAIDFGKPLSEAAPRSDLCKAIAALAKATAESMPAVQHASN